MKLKRADPEVIVLPYVTWKAESGAVQTIGEAIQLTAHCLDSPPAMLEGMQYVGEIGRGGAW